MSRGTVYLGGPITGRTWEEAAAWRASAAHELFRVGWKYLDPMRGEAEQFGFAEKDVLPSTFAGDREAAMRDVFDIERSSVILVNLEGSTRVSIGTMCELGYAYARGKFIITVLPTGDTHDHLFVKAMSSAVVGSLTEAINMLKGL